MSPTLKWTIVALAIIGLGLMLAMSMGMAAIVLVPLAIIAIPPLFFLYRTRKNADDAHVRSVRRAHARGRV